MMLLVTFFFMNYDDRLSSSELYSEYESFGAWARTQITHQFDHSSRSHINASRLRIATHRRTSEGTLAGSSGAAIP